MTGGDRKAKSDIVGTKSLSNQQVPAALELFLDFAIGFCPHGVGERRVRDILGKYIFVCVIFI